MDITPPGVSARNPIMIFPDEPSTSGVQIVEPCHSVRPINAVDITDDAPVSSVARVETSPLCGFCIKPFPENMAGVWAGPCGHRYHVKCLSEFASIQYAKQDKSSWADLPVRCANVGCSHILSRNICDDLTELHTAVLSEDLSIIHRIIEDDNKPFLLNIPLSDDGKTLLSISDITPEVRRYLEEQKKIFEAHKMPVAIAGKKRKRQDDLIDVDALEDEPTLPQTKKMRVLSASDTEIIERDIAVCAENIKRYHAWLRSKPSGFSDDCLKLTKKDDFLPATQSPLLVYDGVNLYLNASGEYSRSAVRQLSSIVEHVSYPRICSACPTPALARAILSMLPRSRKIAILVPMAGAGMLSRMLKVEADKGTEENKKADRVVDVFPYDLHPGHSLVKAASVGTLNQKKDDSFSDFYAATKSTVNSPYHHFVMLLDFPHLGQGDIEDDPLHIAVHKFMHFCTPKSKQIIYWGVGAVTNSSGELQVANPFEQAIERYNQQATAQWGKKRVLEVTAGQKEYPKTFSNEVLQQVFSTIPTPPPLHEPARKKHS